MYRSLFRFVVSGEALYKSVLLSSVGVFRFDTEYSLTNSKVIIYKILHSIVSNADRQYRLTVYGSACLFPQLPTTLAVSFKFSAV